MQKLSFVPAQLVSLLLMLPLLLFLLLLLPVRANAAAAAGHSLRPGFAQQGRWQVQTVKEGGS